MNSGMKDWKKHLGIIKMIYFFLNCFYNVIRVHRLYFSERNIKGMFETLEPLHAMLERGPQTLKETSFNQAYGRDLTQALECCQHFKVIFSFLII